MSKCNQYVAGADRWSAQRQCSRDSKFDTGFCTVHLKMTYKGHLHTMGAVVLQESGYDPRFTDAINFPLIRGWLDSALPACFRQRLLNEAVGLAQVLSSNGAYAPANWDWFKSQQRFYQTIGDVMKATEEMALEYEKSATISAMRENRDYADYDKQIEGFGLDTMPMADYEELAVEYQEYLSDKRAYDSDVQEILGEFREEQTKFITDLRERQRIELAGLIEPTSPMD